ncbi:MAG TPA: flagellar filament capping protein FliD [Xanthomonadaceae bacterium]|nr:flagellar filament capping protein FliD [Xanthomonadaceae bacterium]
MASIVSAGIGSGLDVNALVSGLVSAERAPTENRLKATESGTRAQISAFGALSGALSGLQTALDAFKGIGADPGRKATVGEGAGFTASAGTTAPLGSYAVRVEKLATTHKLQSAALAADAQVGYGKLTLQVGSDDPIEVDIADGDGTLADIRDAINAKAGSQGIAASIVHGDAGDVLVLTSPRSGADGAITVGASGGDGGLAALTNASLTEVTAAQDAEVWVDGVKRTSASNHITDLLDGVTLDLTKAQPGQSFDLAIAGDGGALRTRMEAFVKAYNTAINALRTQSAAGDKDTPGAALSGDAAPRALTQALRTAMGSAYADMSTLGLSTSKEGTLTLDGAKFDAAVAADSGAVRAVLGDGADYATSLRATFTAYLGDEGLISSRTEALNDRLDAIADQREALNRRMAAMEANYRRQFTALDAMMAQMQSTSSFLTQQLAGLSR